MLIMFAINRKPQGCQAKIKYSLQVKHLIINKIANHRNKETYNRCVATHHINRNITRYATPIQELNGNKILEISYKPSNNLPGVIFLSP